MGRTLYAVLVWAALHGAVVQQGWAPHYAPGLMGRVAARRGMVPVACMVSSPTYAVGAWVWVYGLRTGVLKRCEVVDVSGPADRARHLRTGRVAELAFEVTAEICGSTRERVVDCPVLVVKI